MAGVYVDIKPEIIGWILQTIQFDNIAGSVIDVLKKWQTGEKTPTFNQVEEISRKTDIPFGYFFLDKPPKESCPIVEYRTVDSAAVAEPSRNLLDIVDQMTDIQEWMSEYAMENGQEELSFVGSDADQKDVIYVVNDIRKRLGIDINWYEERQNANDSFRFIKGRLGKIGVLFMMSGIVGNNTRRKLDVNEFRAFTLVNKYVPLIFVNSCDSDTGKLFSLFHELAHIWVGENSFYNNMVSVRAGDRGIEKFCNAVAAEILIPTKHFLKSWNQVEFELMSKISEIAKLYRCSSYVVARKALDNGKISQLEYDSVIADLERRFKEWQEKQRENKRGGGDYYRNLESKIDKRLIMALAQSAAEGRTQYTEVYRLTNTNRKTFERLLVQIGGVE